MRERDYAVLVGGGYLGEELRREILKRANPWCLKSWLFDNQLIKSVYLFGFCLCNKDKQLVGVKRWEKFSA